MRAMRMLLLAGAAMIGMGAASPPPRTAGMDTHAIAVQRFGNDAPWYQDRIPFFESADPKIDAVYYYRWQLYRGHQRDLGEEGISPPNFSTMSTGSAIPMPASTTRPAFIWPKGAG